MDRALQQIVHLPSPGLTLSPIWTWKWRFRGSRERWALGQFIKKGSLPNGVMCSTQVQEDCTGLQCLLESILNEHCEGCDLFTGAAEMAETSLIDTEKVFHGWGDSLQGGAFQQLVTYAQE